VGTKRGRFPLCSNGCMHDAHSWNSLRVMERGIKSYALPKLEFFSPWNGPDRVHYQVHSREIGRVSCCSMRW
jgi:hypothetical protein